MTITPVELRELATELDGLAPWARGSIRAAADRIDELERALASAKDSHRKLAKTYVDAARELRDLQYKYGLRSPKEDLARVMSIVDEESP